MEKPHSQLLEADKEKVYSQLLEAEKEKLEIFKNLTSQNLENMNRLIASEEEGKVSSFNYLLSIK